MSTEAVTLGRRFFEEMLAKGDWVVAAEILDENIIMHHPASPVPITPLPAVQGMLAGFRAAFPDLSMTVLDAFGDGDKAVVRWQMQGTHTADLFGMPPTDKAVTVNGISVVQVANGKIVEDWVSEDTMGMMRQLGVVPG
jgi:steroid delta-isomerase-like uncharacterized protein